MKLHEVYKPVFEDKKEDLKARRLRSDFGSRRTTLVCANSDCVHEFTRRIGPNTSTPSCPECGHNRVRLADSEKAKKKLISMREALEENRPYDAVELVIDVLSSLVGKTDNESLPQINEALAGLVAMEPGLDKKIQELIPSIRDGRGHKELRAIAEQLELGHYFHSED
jgi:hypothetical protein